MARRKAFRSALASPRSVTESSRPLDSAAPPATAIALGPRSNSIDHGPPANTADHGPPANAIVLGVDPGRRVVGYGAVVDLRGGPRFLAAGVLRVDPKKSVAERLAWILDELEAIVARVRPSVVVVEQAFAHRNIRAALRIGEARGVILACAARARAEAIEISPAAAKKAVLGHGGADKTRVARMVGRILGLQELPRPLDATDALALAIAHVHRRSPTARACPPNPILLSTRAKEGTFPRLSTLSKPG